MFNAVSTAFHLFFAGAWAFIWSWGLGVGSIILLMIGYLFTDSIPIIGPYLSKVREDLLIAAIAIAIFLGGVAWGTHLEADRNVAKTVIVDRVVDKAVQKSKSPAVQKQRDPFDDPNN